MICPECRAWSAVLLTRLPRRRRECANGHRFSTVETYEEPVTTNYLTPAKLAERWRMEVKTLSNWRVQGKGPAYVKLGDAKVLYPLQAVEAYEQAGVKLPNGGAA